MLIHYTAPLIWREHRYLRHYALEARSYFYVELRDIEITNKSINGEEDARRECYFRSGPRNLAVFQHHPARTYTQQLPVVLTFYRQLSMLRYAMDNSRAAARVLDEVVEFKYRQRSL